MTHASRILITGATGAVGPLVVKAFHDAGYSVRTLSMDSPPVDGMPDDVEALLGDITDKAVVESAVRGVSAVVHLAALLHIVNPPPFLREKYKRINVDGTALVTDAAIRADVRRVVFFSTIAVYGPSHSQILTEDSPPCPDTFYARTKLTAEKIVLDARNANGENMGSVLRLGAVYGSRIKGNYERLTSALASHRFIPIGDGHNRRTLVYDKDVAEAALLVAFHEAAAGRIYNVTDGQFHTLKEIMDAICSALGRKSPGLSLPVGPVRYLAGGIEKGARLFGLKPPITRAMIDTYTEDIAVDGQRIQTELGFLPRYDLVSGWKDAVQEIKEKFACQ